MSVTYLEDLLVERNFAEDVFFGLGPEEQCEILRYCFGGNPKHDLLWGSMSFREQSCHKAARKGCGGVRGLVQPLHSSGSMGVCRANRCE